MNGKKQPEYQPKAGSPQGGPARPLPPITAEQARAIAQATVTELAVGHDYVLLNDRTVEREFGWVFFYTTREYLATRDRKYLVPGTAPFVVHRRGGAVAHLPTSLPPQRAIEVYEAQWLEEHKAGGKP